MPSIKRSLKIARLAVQHLGPPLVRAVFTLAGGVVTNMAANARRPLTHEENAWLAATIEDRIDQRRPGDPFFGTHYLPEDDEFVRS
jgi:hypothetical protein